MSVSEILAVQGQKQVAPGVDVAFEEPGTPTIDDWLFAWPMAKKWASVAILQTFNDQRHIETGMSKTKVFSHVKKTMPLKPLGPNSETI